MSDRPPRNQRTPRTERVNVFCTPAEAKALKLQALHEGKPVNQHVLDRLGIAEVNTAKGGPAVADSPATS